MMVIGMLVLAALVIPVGAHAEAAGVSLVGIETNDAAENAPHVLDSNPDTECVITHDTNQAGDASAAATIDLGGPSVVSSIRVVNGRTHAFRWVTEIEVGPDDEHLRPVLGRFVNLPMWRPGDAVSISFPPAVGRFLRVHFGGVKTGAVSEIEVDAVPNQPERHVLCWADDLERDYLDKLDYLEKDLGATDLWLGFVETAFPQTNTNSGLDLWVDTGALDKLAGHGLRYWLAEHEAFTFMVNAPEDLHDEARWLTTVRQMREVYARARNLGFRGLVFDAEDYDGVPGAVRERYEDTADHVVAWCFHEEFGLGGMYYHRGQQVGRAIEEVWPEAVLIQLYEARMYDGIPGCRDGNYWWLKGIHDQGVEVWIATEKTYGAGKGEMEEPGGLAHLHHWFVNLNTFIGQVFEEYPFAARVLPGFHPWNTRTKRPNYLPKYLDQQLDNATKTTQAYWIYCEGNAHAGDPRDVLDSAACEKYGVTAEDYLDVFRKHRAR